MADPARQEPAGAGRHNLLFRLLLTLGAIIVMANLGAMVDFVFHPEIEYLDEEHLIVGGVTGLMTGIILVSLMLYIGRLEKAVARQQRDKEALAVSEDRYRTIFDNSLDVIFLKTPGGRFIDVNPAGVKLFGYDSREELLGVDIANGMYANYHVWATQQQLMERNGFVENYEIEMVKKNGDHIFVRETATAIFDDDGNIIACRGIMRDITAEKYLEAELQQSQKLESIGRMAGGIAHDFNNYLTTMSGQTEMASLQAPEGSPTQDSLREIRRSIEKASALTRQMLLFSRSQPLNMEPVDLNAELVLVTKQMSDATSDDIDVRLVPDDGKCVVDADSAALSQVLVNLALASQHGMPLGGQIEVSTGHMVLDEEYALAHVEAYPGRFVCLTVSDDGQGMDEDAITHFFEPFFGDNAGQNGMIMAVAYGIIMQHGGWIDVESEPGEGATYRIFLPECDQEERRSEKGRLGDRGRGERILLVEDEEAVRATVQRMLSENGYEVLAAADAEQAFDIFVSERGDIQLVFSDVVLPGESGVELVEHLRTHNGSLPVVLSSGFTERASDLDTIRDREYRFLQKPFSLPDLLVAVRETLAASSA